MPRARLWEDSTPGEDADSHCVPFALGNTPPPLLWLLQGNRLRPRYASRKGWGGGAQAQPFSRTNGICCNFNMREAHKQGVHAMPVECPVHGCG